MAEIIEFVKNYFPLLKTIVSAVAGLALILFGEGVFRRFYPVLCAIMGLYVGMVLHSAFPRDEMYLVAGMICIAAGVIAYENYRCGLVMTAFLASFIASVSFVFRRVYEDTILGIGAAAAKLNALPEKTSLLRLWYVRHKYEGDMKEALSRVYRDENPYTLNSLTKVFEDSTDSMQIGLGISVLIAIFAGLIAIILADYIIIASTSALGSIMLVGIIEETEFLKQIEYNYKLAIFFIGGMVFQIARYYKSIENERLTKKRRGLYEKIRK